MPGVRTETLLNQVQFNWKSVADNLIPIGTRPAYEASLALCRTGLFVGPSSGFAFAGLLKHLSSLDSSELDHIRNEHDEVIAVAIAPDSPFPYIEEYFRYLNKDHFPKIENEHLLNKKEEPPALELEENDLELDAQEFLNQAYGMSTQELESVCKNREEIPATQPFTIIDVRSPHEFKDHHLPGSDPTDYGMLVLNFETIFAPMFKRNGLQPIFVCSYGGKSTALAVKARSLGIEAWSLKGGTLEWSRLGFPRIKNPECVSLKNS